MTEQEATEAQRLMAAATAALIGDVARLFAGKDQDVIGLTIANLLAIYVTHYRVPNNKSATERYRAEVLAKVFEQAASLLELHDDFRKEVLRQKRH